MLLVTVVTIFSFTPSYIFFFYSILYFLNLSNKRHLRILEETAIKTPKKYFFPATIASASSQPPQLFKVGWYLLTPKNESLLSQEQTISCDTFKKGCCCFLLIKYQEYALI